MKTFLYIILCLSFVGCVPAMQPVSLVHNERPYTSTPVAQHGPVNHSGNQLAGINNHGTMMVYVNSPGHSPAGPMNSPGPNPAGPMVSPGRSPAAVPMNSPGNDIKSDEGLRLKPYADHKGKLHIGYGRNLTDKGISKGEAGILFDNDYTEAVADLKTIFPGWLEVPGNVKEVLINMRYQLGPGGFRGFGNMIAAVKAGYWLTAAAEMRDSDWYRDELTRARAERLAQAVESTQ